MERGELLRRRMHAQLLSGPKRETAADVVERLLCVQGQDWGQSLWALASRTDRPTKRGIEAEVAAGAIVRTWPMRGTLHWVRPSEVRWLLDLCGERAMAKAHGRHRQLGLIDADFERAETVAAQVLLAGALSRPDFLQALDAGGVDPSGQRGIHVVIRLAQQGQIVVGPRIGNQPSYRLLTEPQRTPTDPLLEIANRYVRGHGPATAHDLSFWTGLTIAACRDGLERTGVDRDGDLFVPPDDPPPLPRKPLLLAGFDEYVLGYRDRSAVLDDLDAVVPGGNGIFLPTVIAKGRAVGTWKRGRAGVDVTPFVSDVAVDDRVVRAFHAAS